MFVIVKLPSDATEAGVLTWPDRPLGSSDSHSTPSLMSPGGTRSVKPGESIVMEDGMTLNFAGCRLSFVERLGGNGTPVVQLAKE